MAELSNPADNQPAYSQDDVQQILHLAIARQTQDQEDLTRAQLLEIAEELGLSSHDIQAAESQWRSQKRELVHRQAFDRDRHQQFQQRSIKFIIINSFLVALNLLTNGGLGLTWSLYVLVFWGLALMIRARKTYWLNGHEYRKQFENWERKRMLKQSFDSVVSRLLPS